ncbi:unnamed protein product [Lupinus luteus]|uniref:BED-type domain-containing protein n=1 Tax=Lupinus luteus TaxID=3873 RepID=A0AAV1XUL3_LUPLU
MEDVEDEIQESQSVELGNSNKQPKSLTSDVWKYFTKIGVGNDRIKRAKCNGCKTIYRCRIGAGKDYGTSHLHCHKGRCTKIRHDNIGQIVMDKEEKLTSQKIDQMMVRDMLSCAIIEHDLPTRRNSTYLMLEYALKYKNVFEKLHMHDDNYRFSPSVEEWKRAEKIHVFLLPFYRTTNLISGTSYPTSNLYFMQVWKIQCVLLDTLRDGDEVYSVVLAMGQFLTRE